jgi:hypothetical protein
VLQCDFEEANSNQGIMKKCATKLRSSFTMHLSYVQNVLQSPAHHNPIHNTVIYSNTTLH